ncbi:putative CDGSH iron-sulfur domain-containing protein 3-like, partial [Homarus americanus]
MFTLRSFIRLPAIVSTRPISSSVVTYATTPPQDSPGQQKQEEPVEEWKQKGRINAKKSMKVNLVGGKRYMWCACGYSKNQ